MMNSRPVITECSSYDPAQVRAALKSLLDPLGGLDFVKPGMKIGIKCNLCAARKPESAATTHPVPVLELCRMLTERGASVLVGDSPGEPFTAVALQRLYSVSGMKVVEEAGAVLNRNTAQTEVEFPEGVTLKNFSCTSWILDCDALINFCKLKSHGLFGMTCAVKNMFGIVPGTVKSECHFRYRDPEAFANLLIDCCEYSHPVLHICDAVDIMEGNGPTAGESRHLGLFLAGTDPYRIDSLCAQILGLKEEEIPYLAVARKRGLLTATEDKPEEKYRISDFRKSGATCNWFYEDPSDNVFKKNLKKIVYLLMRSKPQADAGCTGCGQCAKGCPADAITIRNGKAVIDRKKCVRCFCCQEFCPSGAMKARRSPVARIVGG